MSVHSLWMLKREIFSQRDDNVDDDDYERMDICYNYHGYVCAGMI